MKALLARVRFPHPLVLFSGAVFLAAAASWVLPTGEYDRTLDEATGRTVVVNRLGERTILVIPIVALLFATGERWRTCRRRSSPSCRCC